MLAEIKNSISKMNSHSSTLSVVSCQLSVFLIIFICSLISPQPAYSFNIPEKFEYDLTWTGIKAGTSTLEITNAGNGIKIISTSKSVKWVSVFYDVDDRVESTLVKNQDILFVGQPVKYRIKQARWKICRLVKINCDEIFNPYKICFRNDVFIYHYSGVVGCFSILPE